MPKKVSTFQSVKVKMIRGENTNVERTVHTNTADKCNGINQPARMGSAITMTKVVSQDFGREARRLRIETNISAVSEAMKRAAQ